MTTYQTITNNDHDSASAVIGDIEATLEKIAF